MAQFLGKNPYLHDPRTLTFARYMDASLLPSIPSTVPLPSVPSWGMMLNDSLGDCAIACPGHLEMAWTEDEGSLFTPTDQQILAAYEAVSGYTPGDASTDTGCVILNVLKYWQQTGIADHKIGAYVRVDTQDQQALEAAIYLFGGVDFGFQLPLSVQGATSWQSGAGNGQSSQPGSWGGHSVAGASYNSDGIEVITWGAPLLASWQFIAQYADEAWATISPDFLNSGVSPDGFNLASLQADLSTVAGMTTAVKPTPRSRRHWWSFV